MRFANGGAALAVGGVLVVAALGILHRSHTLGPATERCVEASAHFPYTKCPPTFS